MKSIRRKDFITVGSVAKKHGTNGELKIRLTEDVSYKQWAFLEIKGKPVPFYILGIAGSGEEPILKLDGVNTPEEAEKYQDLAVLMPKRSVKKKDTGEDMDLEGFLLVDERLGEIGRVEAVEEYPQQLLFRTTFRGQEVLIPAVEAFIIDIDEEEDLIRLDLPEGLIAED